VKPASLISALFLSLIAIGHVIRLVLGVPVTVDGMSIPVWVSLPAAVLMGTLAFFLWRENRTEPPAERATPR
jgi:hypothetical protein